MYKKSITHYISKIIVDVLFYLSIICVAILPFFAEKVFFWVNFPSVAYFRLYTTLIILSGIGCIFILFNLKQMFRTLMTGNPFVDKNVCHLRRIAVGCAVISFVYIVKCIFMFTFATLVVIAVFAIGSLLCLTLKDLFKQAINYKAENDLTI